MDSSLQLDNHQLDAWCHAALILGKKIGVGSKKSNNELSQLLLNFGSIKNIYSHHFSMIPLDKQIVEKLDKIYSKPLPHFGVITIQDGLYPHDLKNIYGTPPVIYYRGDLNILRLRKSISFVGTREFDNPKYIEQGVRAIERLKNGGFEVIVSGLAKGADTLGHKIAIVQGMKTIAVLGTPITVSYPAENKNLQEEIALKHLLVSEYPVGIQSQGSFFANRNLTTVSLSREGIIVARAGDKSGTQYAIKTCSEQNKTIYILENNIYEPDYTWVTKYKSNIKLIRG
ncbi:DNA-processing protein DprA [Pectobacterium brasiliense]|uniref:DNA-processing protein DprA n=1 Tax=Pectobacterium TaxID=122277 RepID=UPI000CE69380|nr:MULTISPECIES: DNA-processing protein DprA [Pectobacterium]MCL6329068.1 DNA processing protein DprA [Pectobacterium carotovorum subsp. carotovorum]PPE57756.1 DNA-processing protein DprA [Pectobacterium brasiliense]